MGGTAREAVFENTRCANREKALCSGIGGVVITVDWGVGWAVVISCRAWSW